MFDAWDQLSFQTVQVSPRFGADHTLAAVLDAAALAGFANVGLDLWTVQRHCELGGQLSDLPGMLGDRGLRCTDVLPLVIGADDEVTFNAARHLATVAATVGARVCGCAVDTTLATMERGRLGATLRESVAILADAGVRLALEHLPYSPLSTLAMAVELCASVGWERAGLMLDSWQVLVTDELAVVSCLPPGAVALVQISDAVFPLLHELVDASRNYRLLPGAGNLDLVGFVRALDAGGFRGPISPEVLSARGRAAPTATFARDLHRATFDLWTRALAIPTS